MTGHERALALRFPYLSLHRRAGTVLSARGVTSDPFGVLWAFSESATLTQRERVERTASDHDTLRAMLVLLERPGLVERRPHPNARRARRVSLTSAGRRGNRRLWRHSERSRSERLEPFSGLDVRTGRPAAPVRRHDGLPSRQVDPERSNAAPGPLN
jgi:MarR family transcriptional regulator, organic hydroperoxide resistance regulator